jgi:plastocyanin
VAVVPVAIALIFFGILFWWVWIALGVIVGVIAAIGWLSDAMREWQQTEYGHAAAGHLTAGAAAGALAAGSSSSAVAVVPAAGGALVPAGGAAIVAEVEERQPPPGVHMPGPSPWPFFAPIALMVIFYGVIFSPALIVGGIVMGVIAAAGWLLDASREYTSTEAVGHAVPRTRDPRAAWPRRLVPIYFAVVVLSLFVMAIPAIGQFLAGLAPPPPGETPVAVPAQPEISASTAVSFDTNTLIVPAGRAFQLVFHNNQDGVPHNVEIADGPDKTTIYFSGAQITGIDSITYQVPNLEAKNYFFFCVVHQNMNGTVEAIPEAGSGGGPEGPPVPGASPSAAAP